MAGDNRINFQVQPWMPLHSNTQTQNHRQGLGSQVNFADVLQEKTEIKFSQHALQRLQQRGLQLDQEAIKKLDQAIEKMAKKGAKESLIYLDDIAFVVSIKNKTVITAMDGCSAKENIFTNIDSALLL